MMDKRDIIFECKVGSQMYGTATPESDTDYKGVFLPSIDDLTSLSAKCPDEWDMSVKSKDEDGKNTKDAVDRQYYSIQKFLSNAMNGQPWALEMLFAPKEMVIISTPEWDIVQQHLQFFMCKNIAGFYGFAKNQAERAVIKGENLNHIQNLISLLDKHKSKSSAKIFQHLYSDDEGSFFIMKGIPERVKKEYSESGAEVITVAGRKFDVGLSLKKFQSSLQDMEQKYGDRVRTAANDGFDWKSLYHAYRLISEAEEFLEKGTITLPRPDAELLLKIRRGEYDVDHREELMKGCERIRKAEKESFLPDEPNRYGIQVLCRLLLLMKIEKHTGVSNASQA